jgi:hypothetical protein
MLRITVHDNPECLTRAIVAEMTRAPASDCEGPEQHDEAQASQNGKPGVTQLKEATVISLVLGSFVISLTPVAVGLTWQLVSWTGRSIGLR